MTIHSQRRQRGVALVTALLVTAIATITAVALASRQQLDIRRTENMLERDQAYLFGLGVEEWARQILAQDRRDNNIDHPGENWASILPPITVEGAVVAGSIEDLQGRFNLNNLVQDGQASAPDIQRFQRLLRALDLDEGIARAVADWIDPDEEPAFPDGAEDNEYLRLVPPYRTANAPMANASELLLVKGVDYDTYRALRPYVTALPARTAINVNTAPVPVLMSLAAGLSQGDAELLVEERGENGYETIADFLNQPPFQNANVQIPDIGVASDHFLLTADVRFGRSHLQLFSLFARSADAKVQVAMRTQGTW